MGCKCGCHDDGVAATGWRKYAPMFVGVAVVGAIIAGAALKGDRPKQTSTPPTPPTPTATPVPTAGALAATTTSDSAFIAGASRVGGVNWIGEMHKAVHEGDAGGKVALASLLAAPHLFALGPVAGLRGEITVIDGAASIGLVGDAGPFADSRADVQAAFLVWAHEARWVRLPIPENVRTEQEIEDFVPRAARDAGLPLDEPVPFRIVGRAERVELHVIWQDAATPPGKEAHDTAKVPAVLSEADVAIVGFWSDLHRGVFTPAFSDIHMHVVSVDGETTGHVEGVRLAPGAVLLLPDRSAERKDAP